MKPRVLRRSVCMYATPRDISESNKAVTDSAPGVATWRVTLSTRFLVAIHAGTLCANIMS